MDAKLENVQALLTWYRAGKRDLPWRKTKDPYPIWISEIMLQQTRVESVKGYYARFLSLFPTVTQLAAAPQEQVLKVWEGLGYYSRARNLQKAAKIIVTELDGKFPSSYIELLRLPGIGAYTAGAIASIAFGERVPAIDGNVNRVASRFFGIREDIGSPKIQKEIRTLISESLPSQNVGDYNQGLMELGATLCIPRTPKCCLCPWQNRCDAYAEQDAELLPIHEKKRPPKPVDIAVCLLTCKNQILVVRRSQRLLQGLYVFPLLEEESSPTAAQALLSEQGLECTFSSYMGTARHIFTHRIWQMSIFHFFLDQPPAPDALKALKGQMLHIHDLTALPFPSAMKVPSEKALSLENFLSPEE